MAQPRLTQSGQNPGKAAEARLNGTVIIGELLRNMELGRFDMAYSVLLPCVFTIYLNPEDHATLSGVFDLVIDDARRALRARVAELNAKPGLLGLSRPGKPPKDHKIACRDWDIEFLPDSEVPMGDVEIHSELNETVQPGFRGTKTTLINREPSASAQRAGQKTTGDVRVNHSSADTVYAEVRYQDDSGPQVYLIVQNHVRVGRGGNDQPMDLALYTNDEVSREHLVIRRDPATGAFYVCDSSTNGTWVNGKKLRKSAEEPLPERAEIAVGEILTLQFEVRK
ncbi:MAG TPA: FHA domain-containing protein [Bryobacteraceae bacterium]|nr:FHA domain-containing protein [Bryobacteraceae bacterium]